MDEDSTKKLPIDRSLAEMILARLDSMDARLTKIEEQNERRAMETKPIWERALAEIMAIKEEVIEVKNEVIEVKEHVRKIDRKMSFLSDDVIEVRAEQQRLDNRIDKMKSKPY